jgi:hypothetical protein
VRQVNYVELAVKISHLNPQTSILLLSILSISNPPVLVIVRVDPPAKEEEIVGTARFPYCTSTI